MKAKTPIKKPVTKPAPRTPAGDPLVGKCFLTFNDDKAVSHQGRIVASYADARLLLVEYFEWITGTPDVMALVAVGDLVDKLGGSPRVLLFVDAEDMRDWSERHPQ